MFQDPKHKRRSFSDEFKRDAVNQGYSFRAAADAVGVGEAYVSDTGNSSPSRSPPVTMRRSQG